MQMRLLMKPTVTKTGGPDGKPMDFNFKFDNDFKNSAEEMKREWNRRNARWNK